MATKRFVNVEIGGENRQLKFDFNAVADLEDFFGKGIGSIMSEEQVGFRTIRAMYWAGLKWRNRKLTVNQVGHWLQDEIENGTDFEELFQPVIEAMQAAGLLGTDDESDDANSEEGEAKNG